MAMLPKADVVLRGGRVFVAYGAPVAEAIALWSGKVLAVGSSSDMEPLIGPGLATLSVTILFILIAAICALQARNWARKLQFPEIDRDE